MLSALYAKLLVIMGICFPLAEVISKKIPVSFYEGFYLYLYFGSIAFLLYVYVFLLRHDKVNAKLDHLTDSFSDKVRAAAGAAEFARHQHGGAPDSQETRLRRHHARWKLLPATGRRR
uniref:Putative conserved plasma membrane protein n=1 Tax=Amblyomma cajennense TaxID=34607 RepID=A0A023FDY1_AMBCJ